MAKPASVAKESIIPALASLISSGNNKLSVAPHAASGTSSRPVALDLFAGCGGLSLGLSQAGFRVAAAVEVNADAAACYEANHPGVHLFHGDIRKVSVSQLKGALGRNVGLVAGCPPCQGFSRIGTRNAPSAARTLENSLYLEFLRIVRGLRPRAVMLENVPAFGKGSRFRRLTSELSALGYELFSDVLDAADYGVPQRRARLILLGVLGVRPVAAQKSGKRRTVADAFGLLPAEFLAADALHNLPQRFSERVSERIRAIPQNGGSRAVLRDEQILDCHREHDGFSDVYGRMRWDAVAPTITAGIYTPSKGRFLHPEANRCISLREAAVLQTFPRSYRFPIDIGKMQLAALIGNALPPEFIRRHAVRLLRTMRAA